MGDNKPQPVRQDFANCFLGQLNNLLYNEFVGYNKLYYSGGVQEEERKKARYILNNVRLCNMCYWREFTCQFEKYYFKLPIEEQGIYANIYFEKIPSYWGDKAKAEYERGRKPDPSVPYGYLYTDGLAGRKKALQTVLEEACKRSKETTEMQRGLGPCCDPHALDLPGTYGCGPSGRRRSSRRRKPKQTYRRRRRKPTYTPTRRKRRYFRRRPAYTKPRRKKRYFRKKKTTDDSKPKDTKKKENCKCWVCQEEGHYANECPNRKTKEQNRILEVAYAMKLEPVEEIQSEYSYSLYSYTESEDSIQSEYEEEDFSSDPGSEWELVKRR